MSDKEEIAQAAMDYAALGWYVIPVVKKKPLGGLGWPAMATRDPGEAACLFEDLGGDGVGVVLGPRSGIIDLECDSEQAERELLELFGGDVPPTAEFQSTRGRHRLFRWCDSLPEKARNQAKVMVGAIEARTGGGGKAAQTVFPPSPGRRWIVAPWDVEIADLPPAVIGRLIELLAVKRLPASEYVPDNQRHGGEQLDVARWLLSRGVEILRADEHGDVRRWFIRCPRIECHTTDDGIRDCVVTQDAAGKLGGHCFHASCGMSDWQALSNAIGRPQYADYHTDEPEVNQAAVDAILRQGAARIVASEAAGPSDDADEDCTDELGDSCDGSFPAACLNPAGLLSEVMAYTLATSLYPQPELALAGALALVGTVTGRKVTDAFGTRTNVYVLGLGMSGCGKEQARRVNKDLLLRSGGEKLIGSERVGSHAGIVTTIHETPASLMQLDEMGRLLETMRDPRKSPHLFNCITVLMQLYSSSATLWKADAYADAKKVKTIDQPHLCIYGTATPDSFWHSLHSDNISEGLVGRLLVFEGRGYEVQMQAPAETQAPQELIDALRWWNDYQPGGNLASAHPTPLKVPHTPEAAERFLGHVKAINERRTREHPLRAAVWSRSAEKVAKLALIHACSRSRCAPETVARADVDWGISLGNWLTRRLLVGCAGHVSENDVEARAKRVLGLIPAKGITLEALGRRTQWLRSRERNEIVQDLIGLGLVESETIPVAKSRPKMVLRKRKKQPKLTT